MRDVDTGTLGCPDSELLAQFIDGRLSGATRAGVVRHLADCEMCGEMVAGAAAILPAVVKEALPARAGRFQRNLPALLGGLALAASMVVAVRVLDLWPGLGSTSYEQLIAAVGSVRTVDGRLSGFPWGAAASVARGETTSPLSSNWQALAAAARIRSEAEAEPSADNQHALGVAHLVLGEYDEAVRNLELAVSRASGDARAHSDLAVAYVTRAARLERPADFAHALTEAERALAADSSLAEAYFNRAVALEGLSLEEQAREAWREYLARDPQGPWADEARARLGRRGSAAIPPFSDAQAALGASLAAGEAAAIQRAVDTYPLGTFDYFVETVMPRWADQVLASQDGKVELSVAQRLADAFVRRGPDRAAAVMLMRIDTASAGPDHERRLARLHHVFAEAQRLQRADRAREASETFARCASEEMSAHPLALECGFRATAASLNRGDRTLSRATLARIAAAAEHGGYLDLLGRVRWRQALFVAMDGDLTGALASYQQALEAFSAARVTEHEANVHSLMSEILRIIGDMDGAWRQHLAALDGLKHTWSPSIRHQILVQTLMTSLDGGMPEVGLHVVDALIAADRAWGHQPSLALAYAHRSRALTMVGRQTEALAALADARRAVTGVPDPDYQRRFETEVLAAEIAVLGPARPQEMLAAADQGLANVRYTGSAPRQPGFLFARATAQASLGRLDGAEHDYRAALDELEAERERLSPDTRRISHLERNFAQVRAFVEFELTQRRDPARALVILEQARARWLLAAVRGVAARPASPDSLIPAIDARTAVVYYGVLGQAVHVWVLTNRGMSHQRLATTVRDLDASVQRLWTTLQAGAAGERALLVDLHERLIAPLRRAVADRPRLVFIPDGSIYNVPLAALIDVHTGRYLVEDVSVSVSPSLTLAALRPETRVAQHDARTVGIFGGNVTRGGFLPELAAEQQAVASIYPSASTHRYAGGKEEFLENVDRHDIVHFAGHAVANVSDPALSRLEFPTLGEVPSGDVLAADIIGLRLHRVRIVVLAACRTGWGANVAGEGTLSLSHAFLGAGAGSVLASLWDVDDHATRLLLTTVHDAMAGGASLTDAVRAAQLRALSGTDPAQRRPARWAAFVATIRS
jgi:CHAT domain-containing protein